MKKMFIIIFILLMGTGSAAGCIKQEPAKQGDSEGNRTQVEIMVSAAASLKDAMDDIKLLYEEKNPDNKLILNFASSGTLQQQIEQGAPVDLFISAGKNQMDALEDKQLIVSTSRVNIMGNELVLITGKGDNAVKSFEDLIKPEVKHIGIGQPESVPAGKYAKEVLTSLKLWDPLKSKCVQAKDVRQVLAYVETGNAEAGLVYKSDTIISDKVKIAAVAPAGSHKLIIYPAAVIRSSKNKAAAAELLEFMSNPEAMQIFIKYGFKELEN